MKATIKIDMNNEAFRDCNGTELARILRRLASLLENENYTSSVSDKLRDINGNTVGTLTIK